jgi:hypothetical protein
MYVGLSISVVGLGIALQCVSPRVTLLAFGAAVSDSAIAASPALLGSCRYPGNRPARRAAAERDSPASYNPALPRIQGEVQGEAVSRRNEQAAAASMTLCQGTLKARARVVTVGTLATWPRPVRRVRRAHSRSSHCGVQSCCGYPSREPELHG